MPHRSRLGHFELAALALFLAACRAPTPEHTPSLAPAPLGDFAPCERIGVSPGIFDWRDSSDWIVGNELVYGLALAREQSPRRWFVRMTVRSLPREIPDGRRAPFRQVLQSGDRERTFPSRALDLEIATYDASGKEQHRGIYPVPADFLQRGLYDGGAIGLQLAERADGVPTEDELDALQRSLAAWLSLFSLAHENPTLEPLVDLVVAKPSVFAVLRHGLKLEIGLLPALGDARRAAPIQDVPHPILALPFEVRIYDSPALVGTAFVAPCVNPILPGAGIIAIEAAHPADPSRAMSLRLLSARIP